VGNEERYCAIPIAVTLKRRFQRGHFMNEEQRNNITLETLATILGGSFLFNLVILLLWFIIVLFAPAWYYTIIEKLLIRGSPCRPLLSATPLEFNCS
jgi:hypothetical protein